MTHCPHCGGVLDGKGRSVPQHRRLFGLIAAAFQQWPERAEFQPSDPEHLRKYLLCRAGHREATEIAAPYIDSEPAITRLVALSIEQAIRAAGAYAFVRPDAHGGRVAVYRAKSIAFDKLSHRDACRLFDELAAIIEAEVGVPADQLLREHERAA